MFFAACFDDKSVSMCQVVLFAVKLSFLLVSVSMTCQIHVHEAALVDRLQRCRQSLIHTIMPNTNCHGHPWPQIARTTSPLPLSPRKIWNEHRTRKTTYQTIGNSKTTTNPTKRKHNTIRHILLAKLFYVSRQVVWR